MKLRVAASDHDECTDCEGEPEVRLQPEHQHPTDVVAMKYLIPLLVVSAGCTFFLLSRLEIDGLTLPRFTASDESDVAPLVEPASRSTEFDVNEAGNISDPANAPQLVLYKFGAPWCPPCRQIDIELRKLGRTELPVEIRTINVDQRPAMAEQYGVTSIPRLILLQDGRKIGDLVGYQSAEELNDWIKDRASDEALAGKKRPAGPAVVHSNPFFQ